MPSSREHVVRRGVELLDRGSARRSGGHRRIDRELDDVAAAAPLQRASRTGGPDLRPLPRSRPRCRAGCGTRPAPTTAKPGNRWSRNSADHLLERQEADPRCRAGGRSGRSRRGIRSQRLHAIAVADPLELQRQAEAAIGDERERMRRVDRERRQHREDLGHEALFEPGAVARLEIGRAR